MHRHQQRTEAKSPTRTPNSRPRLRVPRLDPPPLCSPNTLSAIYGSTAVHHKESCAPFALASMGRRELLRCQATQLTPDRALVPSSAACSIRRSPPPPLAGSSSFAWAAVSRHEINPSTPPPPFGAIRRRFGAGADRGVPPTIALLAGPTIALLAEGPNAARSLRQRSPD